MKKKTKLMFILLLLVPIVALLMVTRTYSFPSLTDHPVDAAVIEWEKDGTKDGSSAHNHRSARSFRGHQDPNEPYNAFGCWDNTSYRVDRTGTFDEGHCFIDTTDDDNIPKYYIKGTNWPSGARARVRDAFAAYSGITSDKPDLVIGVQFKETMTESDAEIKLIWENQNGAHGGGFFRNTDREIHFDSSVNWSYVTDPASLANDEWHFLSVALHEIGHAVSFGHQRDNDLMDPTVGQPPNVASARHFVAPDADTIEGVRDLYSQPRRRIAFVIDDTGSMADEISLVKTTVSDKVDQFVAEKLALDYHLLTYKDDVSYRGKTNNPDEIKSWVNSLSATGGGDCPEEMLGALNRIADEAPHSEAWVMTDAGFHGGAGAVASTIYKLLQAKVTVHPIVYSWCFDSVTHASSGQMETNRLDTVDAAFGPEVFGQVALETGGHYFLISTGETQDAASVLLNEMVMPTDMESTFDKVSSGDPKIYKVVVDSSSETVNFLVNSFSGAITMTVIDPHGTTVTGGDPGVNYTSITNAQYYEITNPDAGEWTARIEGNGEFAFSASGDSTLLFEYLSDTSLALVAPVTLRASLSGDYASADFTFTELDGSLHEAVELFDDGLHGDGSEGDGLFAAEYVPTETGSFYLRVDGLTSDGSAFQRTAPQIIRVHTLSADVSPANQSVLPGSEITYSFTVQNGSAADDTFGITKSSSQGWADLSGIPTSVALKAGESETFKVKVTVPPAVASGAVDETVLAFVSLANPLVNDTASAITTAVIAADMELELSDDDDPIGFGEVTYTAQVNNKGPLDASNVKFNSEIIAGVLDDDPIDPDENDVKLVFKSVKSSQGNCDVDGAEVSCSLGKLSSGKSVKITMVVDPPAKPLTITNVSSISANEDDTDFGNNSTSETTVVAIYEIMLPIVQKKS